MKDPLIKCKKCGYDEDSSEIEFNHIIPKSIGGTDLDGRAYLCKDCHKIWHYLLPKFI